MGKKKELSQEEIRFLVRIADSIRGYQNGYWMRHDYTDDSHTTYQSYCVICNTLYKHNFDFYKTNKFCIEHGIYHLTHKAFL